MQAENTGTNLAYLSLGSNIEPEQCLPQAVAQLARYGRIKATSSVWQTTAVGFTEQADFLNAAVLAHTSLDLQRLKKEVLRPLEMRLGRVRTDDKNAPRTIDIDIVAGDALPLDEDMWQLAHIAVPVAELLPNLRSAKGETMVQAVERLSHHTSIRHRPDISLA